MPDSSHPSMLRWLAATLGGVALSTDISPRPAAPELHIGAYGGMNSNFRSATTLHKEGLHDARTLEWEGRPFLMPPYWGVAATYWFTDAAGWGIGVDYTHTKAYSGLNFASDPVYRHLEFTDGNNLLLLN